MRRKLTLVTLGTYRVKWINNKVWFRCSVSHGGSSSTTPDKYCHLVPAAGHFPRLLWVWPFATFLGHKRKYNQKCLLAVKSLPTSNCTRQPKILVRALPTLVEFGSLGFLRKGENGGYPEKIPRVETSVFGEYPQGENRSNRRKAAWSQEENEQKSQPTSGVTSGPY